MRGLSASAVVLGHVRGLFLVDYSEVNRPNRLHQVFYVVSGLGHQAVVVFFVLMSGFFIGHSVLGARATGTFSPRVYAMRRLTRLDVVLVPALALTFAVDNLGIALFGASGTVYGGEVHAPQLELPVVSERLGLLPLLVALAQLQHVFGLPEYGSNGPLWSLPYEFWAYALFPALLYAVLGSGKLLTRAATMAACVGLFIGARSTLSLYFAIWLLGALVAWWWLRYGSVRSTKSLPRAVLVGALTLFALVVLVGRLRLLGNRFLEDLVVGAATSLFVVALLQRKEAWCPSPWQRGSTWLASISYTLYLVHYPAIAFLHAGTLGSVRMQLTVPAMGAVVGLSVALVVAWAWPIAMVTERHTDRVRRWLEARLGGYPRRDARDRASGAARAEGRMGGG
jgi:peptidoglycan/LPS O-acetylase OafA/YrhL